MVRQTLSDNDKVCHPVFDIFASMNKFVRLAYISLAHCNINTVELWETYKASVRQVKCILFQTKGERFQI